MRQILLVSDAEWFDYLMHGEEVVVRNYKMVTALFAVHFAHCPREIKEVLAQPEFSGSFGKEEIYWTTELFESSAVPLSKLEGEEKSRYQSILSQTLDTVRDVLITLPESVSSQLLKAITYHSEHAIFCADGKVVLTEWGMKPKGSNSLQYISIFGGMAPGFVPENQFKFTDKFDKNTSVNEQQDSPKQHFQNSTTQTATDASKNPDKVTQGESIIDNPRRSNENRVYDDSHIRNQYVEDPSGKGGSGNNGGKKKRWWLWLLLLIPLLLLVLLLRRCGDDNVLPPPVSEDDLIWSDDTLTKVVKNRIILLFSGDKSVDDFKNDFRKLYPSKDYQLYAPDDDLPRVILTLPEDELESMSKRLPDEFPDYELMVLPESVFENDKSFTDPAFSDTKKSWYFNMIHVNVAWDKSIGNPDLVVAIIDDGFDLKHPELKGKEIVKPYNAAEHSNNVYADPKSGHGTHVASTAVGRANNGEGSAGIAPACKLMPIKVANKNGVMTTSAIVDAVLYAIKNGADVVNMSLGQMMNPMIAMLPEYAQKQIINTQFLTEEKMWNKIFHMGMSNGKDIAFVLAGGNQNMLIGLDAMQRVEGTIRVSAVASSKLKANFSNFGDYSDLSAPGVDIYNAVSGKKKYDTYSGTSMASPIVAGCFALMKSLYPNMKVDEIRRVLQHTGVPSLSKVGNIVNFADALNYMNNGPGHKGVMPEDPNKRITPVLPKDPVAPSDPIMSDPSNPLNPTNPKSPLNPSNPTSPLNPNNPSSPLHPKNPKKPIDPTNPDSPYNPNNPSSPFNPSNPNSPLNPSNPNSPLNPSHPDYKPVPTNPKDPSNPYNPKNPGSPFNPSNPSSPFNPSNPGSPLNPGYPGNIVKPTDPADPCPDCTEAQRRYQELLRQMDELKREYPGCY